MVDKAMLYYRTPTTRVIDVPDPDNLPAGQKLEFLAPDDLLAGLTDDYTNNIVRKPPPQPSGRRINQTDEGVAGWLITIDGNFINNASNPSTKATTKLHTFRILAQADTYHVHGCFGLRYPNGPVYEQLLEPSSIRGLMIANTRGRHIGTTKEIFDFSVTLSYGGDVV